MILYKKPISIYKPAEAIITPDIILIQSECFIIKSKRIFDIKIAIMNIVKENPPAKRVMLITLKLKSPVDAL